MCGCVRAPPVSRHSWLGCAVSVCVLGPRVWLCHATPGWGVGICVCLCVRLTCTPPLQAGVCGVPVCALAQVLAAPRHSMLGFLGCVCVCVRAPVVPRHFWLGRSVWVCVLGLAFWLRPATPGWGVGMCVCLCARSACILQKLGGVCGVAVCALARVLAAPRHFWLGCWGVCVCVCVRARPVPCHSWLGCAGWVCVLGLCFRLRPATPAWGVAVCVCLCARPACTPPLLAGAAMWVCVLGLRFRMRPAAPGLGGGVCACLCARSSCTPPLLARVLGCVCVLVCALLLYPATPGWGVRCGCVCLGSGFGCAPPLLAGVLWCVCLCVRSSCTPPFLAGLCGVGVCAWALSSAAARHSCLGCCGLCVFVCAPRFYPASPSSGVRCGCVCLGSGLRCARPPLAGVLGSVCFCVRAPLVPRHSWLGCAASMCVLLLRFWLRPAPPGWVVGVCVFVCVRSPPVPRHSWLRCAVWVCVLGLGFLAASRHSWLVCSGLCVSVCALHLYPATPSSGVKCGCVCLDLGFWLCPATSGWGVGVCMCLRARSSCTPPLLACVLGCVCVCVRAPPVPRHSWLGCAVWVCVLGLGSMLRPASPGWGVRVCVCLCVWSACIPPLLAGACGVGVCAWALVSAAPRGCWLGRGCVCVCLCARSACTPPLLAGVCGVCLCAWARVLAAPRHSWLAGWLVCLSMCALRLYPAIPGWGSWCVGWVLPDTRSCAVISCGLCALPGFPAPGRRCCLALVLVPGLWPAACLSGVPRGPALVRRASSGSVALGDPVSFPDAVVPFSTPAENRALCACR